MNELSRSYEVGLDIDRHSIHLREMSGSDAKLTVEVLIDDYLKGHLELRRSDLPHLALGSNLLLLWAGMQLYAIELGPGNQVHQGRLDSNISAAFPVRDMWCLVCEHSLHLLDARTGITSARFDHGYLIIEQW